MILLLKTCTAVVIGYVVLLLCRLKVVFFQNRPKTLRQMIYSLQIIYSQMVFSYELLPSLVHRMSKEVKYPVSKLWSEVSSNLTSKSLTFDIAFESALKDLQNELFLSTDDIACLELLSKQLGQSDLDSQLKMIKITMDKLLILEKQSESEKKQQVRLWNALGVLGGISIVILLW